MIPQKNTIQKYFSTPKIKTQIKTKKVDFKELRVDNMNYNVIFELKINADYKTNEFIIDTKDNNVFVFNSIFTKPKIYKTLSESLEVFDINKTKFDIIK